MSFMSPFPKVPDRLGDYVLFELYKGLPPPHDDRPETLATRDLVATVAVANLGPMTTLEAKLAAQAVAAQTQSMDALISAAQNPDNLTMVMQCRAQAASMLRAAVRAMRQLRELREERETVRARRRAHEEADARHAAAKAHAQDQAQAQAQARAQAQAEAHAQTPAPAETAVLRAATGVSADWSETGSSGRADADMRPAAEDAEAQYAAPLVEAPADAPPAVAAMRRATTKDEPRRVAAPAVVPSTPDQPGAPVAPAETGTGAVSDAGPAAADQDATRTAARATPAPTGSPTSSPTSSPTGQAATVAPNGESHGVMHIIMGENIETDSGPGGGSVGAGSVGSGSVGSGSVAPSPVDALIAALLPVMAPAGGQGAVQEAAQAAVSTG